MRTILEAEEDIEVCGEVADGLLAVSAAEQQHPDVVLMDIRMPNLDGLEATRRIAARGDIPRIVILTTFDLDEYVFEALRGGASGFLLKDTTAEELVRAVRVALAGGGTLPPWG